MNNADEAKPGGTVEETHESRQSLWHLTVAPGTWALHFLACYVTAAIWCERFAGREGGLGWVRGAIGVGTLIALAVIALTARSGWKRHTLGEATLPHDFDTPEDRHRFLGFATFLLAVLSAVATVFTALVALFFSDCR
jgi:hypothetical protein